MTERLSAEMLEKFKDVEQNYYEIKENILRAAESTGRKESDIIFLAATKTVEPAVINHAISLGDRKSVV